VPPKAAMSAAFRPPQESCSSNNALRRDKSFAFFMIGKAVRLSMSAPHGF